LLYFLLRNWRPVTVNRTFGKLQLFSAAYMGFSHGTNDAQKTMGIITLALVVATKAGLLASAPFGLTWLQTPKAHLPDISRRPHGSSRICLRGCNSVTLLQPLTQNRSSFRFG